MMREFLPEIVCQPAPFSIRRPDRERADRDHVAVAVPLDAIGERAVHGGLLVGSLQAEAGAPCGADGDRVPAHAIAELADDLVARIGHNRGIGRGVEVHEMDEKIVGQSIDWLEQRK